MISKQIEIINTYRKRGNIQKQYSIIMTELTKVAQNTMF